MGANMISNKSFQRTLTKKLESENQEVIYCADDDEYRVYCEKLAFNAFNDFIKTTLNLKLILITIVKKQHFK